MNLFQLPPDLFSRNTVIASLVKVLIGDSQASVLDVGGYGGKLSLFLPANVSLSVLDKQTPPADENNTYTQADAKNLPYEANSFEVVIASDLLEHVAESERKEVIEEIKRVSKNFIIIGTPCYTELTQETEQQIAHYFKAMFGNDHPFLVEHKTMGLPTETSIDTALHDLGLSVDKVKEGNILGWHLQQLYASLWQQVQQFSHSGENSFHASFYKFYNQSIFELGALRQPSYRTIWYASKNAELPKENIQENLAKFGWNSAKFLLALTHAFEDLGNWLNQLQQAKETTNTQQKELELENSLTKARQVLQVYRQTLQEVREVIHTKEKLYKSLETQLNEQKNLVKYLKSEKEKMEEHNRKQEQLLTVNSDQLEAYAEKQQFLNERIESEERKNLEKDEQLRQKEQLLQEIKSELENHQRSLREVMNSKAWKTALTLGRIKKRLSQPFSLFFKGWRILWHLGPKVFWKRVKRKMKKQKTLQIGKTPYNIFLEKEQAELQEEKKRSAQIMANFKYRPTISIIVPVYNVPKEYLVKAIESVRRQWYPHWELCLADDKSTQDHIKPLLEVYAKRDARIKINYRKENGGIVKATNDALRLAKGEYVGFLDNDDELTENALYEVVKVLQKERYGLIYSDEDKLSMDGERCDAFFKPDWSPDLLLSHNYICHFAVYDAGLVSKVGGLREGYDGSQDYDLVLRVTELTDKIYHIPKILYHWRKIPGSTAAEVNAKPYVFAAAKKALADALQRRNTKGEILDGIWTGSYRTKRALNSQPLVSIIIPFRDKPEILKPCVESILQKSTYTNYEILLVDNQSEQPETMEYLRGLEALPDSRIRILTYNHPFNFSAINNYAANKAKGEILLLLNNDTEVITPDWLEAMLEHVLRPEIGAVGVKLLYPVNLVQHAGVLVGIGGIANHAFLKQSKDDHGYFGQIDVVRNYSAVTGACLMVRKEVYEEMKGLNEKELAVAFNDVDFCLRLRKQGYLIVYTPYAQLYHYESLSRGYSVNIKEVEYMEKKYAIFFEVGDSYYNPNLSRERFDFSLRIEDKMQSV